ncbi:response regulator [Paenibacillus alkalitolerans]|uniref:response regulator n=1 Tax=Paenibacillus alkalitolerans TaxID=2799335 RepID=UPI0018F5F813|nr:response regulator [Paenibacillus alkalitolerans]
MKHKALLVDDEPLAIEGLKLMIDWEKYGFEICGECENGEEALQRLESCNPDVVVTDIHMPVMNGLDFIERARKQGQSDVIFIVLSGFGEFEYAKKAMEFGVHHYLLKPFIDEEAEEVLSDISSRLAERRRKAAYREFAAKADMHRLLSELLEGEDPDSDAGWPYLNDLERKAPSWRYIHIRMDESEHFAVKQAVVNHLEHIPCIAINDREPGVLGIVCGMSDRTDVRMLAELLIQVIRAETDVLFGISIGEKTERLSDIRRSYLTALEAFEHLFFMNGASYVLHEDVREMSLRFNPAPTREADAILQSLEFGDQAQLDESIDEWLAESRASRAAPDMIRMSVCHIIFKSLTILREAGADVATIADRFISGGSLRLSNAGMSGLESLLRDFCVECRERLGALRERGTDRLMTEVREYLDKHYRSGMTIKEIASVFYVHPVYLGKAFADKYGVGIQEYVHNLRIDEAARLLRDTELKPGAIAEKVGYASYNHFLKHFEKRIGLKPAKYKATKF